MRTLLLFFFLFASTALSAESARSIVIRDWSITVPNDAEVHKSDGPDFSVTYFMLPKLESQFGIYEGGHPQEFASKQPDVTKQKDRIGGQDVVWSLWKEKSGEGEVLRAELFLVCAVTRIPNVDITYEEKFHIFLVAADQKALSAMQDIVRTLKKKNG